MHCRLGRRLVPNLHDLAVHGFGGRLTVGQPARRDEDEAALRVAR